MRAIGSALRMDLSDTTPPMFLLAVKVFVVAWKWEEVDQNKITVYKANLHAKRVGIKHFKRGSADRKRRTNV